MLDMAVSMSLCCSNIEATYPVLKTLLAEKGISVQGQDHYVL